MEHRVIQLAYSSRSCTGELARALEVRTMLAGARRRNRTHRITGMLLSANGRFVQLIEGPEASVHALYEQIRSDPRHRDVRPIWTAPTESRSLATWDMCLVEPSESEAVTERRLHRLHDRLANDPVVSVADFFRILIAPSLSSDEARPRSGDVRRLAFCSPGGIWNASLLQQVARSTSVSAGRTRIDDGSDTLRRSVVEYLDVTMPDLGPVRAITVPGDPAGFAPVMPLLENLALFVIMLGSSDVAPFEAALERWAGFLDGDHAPRHILLVCASKDERIDGLVGFLRQMTPATVDSVAIKLNQTDTIWREVCDRLPASPPHDAVSAPGFDTRFDTGFVDIVLEPDPVAPSRLPQASLDRLLTIDGAIQAAVLDLDGGKVVWVSPPQAGSAMFEALQWMRIKRRLVGRIEPGEDIEDISLTTTSSVQILRPLAASPSLVLAVTLERAGASLASARLALEAIEAELGAAWV